MHVLHGVAWIVAWIVVWLLHGSVVKMQQGCLEGFMAMCDETVGSANISWLLSQKMQQGCLTNAIAICYKIGGFEKSMWLVS